MLDAAPTSMEAFAGAMRRALQLAGQGEGFVEPNPMVGAVLVQDGRIVAEGWHERFGGPHAEVMALRQAQQRGVDVRCCTMVVTLEPCAHHGKTPPCAAAVLEAGVPRVVAAMQDPFAQVAGQGIAQLKAAGVRVDVGLLEDEARELNAPFLKRVATGLPWVIAKWAQTLDGRIATRTGDSRWISSEASRRQVHALRARVDAVMVGRGTVVGDDPQLTARDVPVRRVAKRVVIATQPLPEDCRLLSEGGESPLVFASPAEALRELGDVHRATNVVVEGGATLLGSMLRDGLIDEAQVYIAPRLLGDERATPAMRGLTVPRIAEATALRLVSAERVGEDVALRYRFGHGN